MIVLTVLVVNLIRWQIMIRFCFILIICLRIFHFINLLENFSLIWQRTYLKIFSIDKRKSIGAYTFAYLSCTWIEIFIFGSRYLRAGRRIVKSFKTYTDRIGITNWVDLVSLFVCKLVAQCDISTKLGT